MTAVTFTWATVHADGNIFPGANLQNLSSSGAYAISNEVDNTPATGNYTDAWLEINLQAAVTLGSGNPAVNVYLIFAPNGTNYPDPPDSGTVQPALSALKTTMGPYAASVTNAQRFISERFDIPPFKFKIMIYWNMGVATPNNTSNVGNLYRANGQAA